MARGLSGPQIMERARAIVAEHPGGIRYGAIVQQIGKDSPATPSPSIRWNLNQLLATYPSEISKPSRGLFTPRKPGGDEPVIVPDTEQITPSGAKIRNPTFMNLSRSTSKMILTR